MHRKATAVWQGGLKDGKGTITTESRVLSETQYSFSTRFENGIGTNPEELIAGAHAGCFSMALSAQLELAGWKPTNVNTNATVKLEKVGEGWSVTEVHLDVSAEVPKIDRDKFLVAAENAKKNCPISKLLNAKISMDARLK
jgi:lipoyl-dependent peroxiredoxin